MSLESGTDLTSRFFGIDRAPQSSILMVSPMPKSRVVFTHGQKVAGKSHLCEGINMFGRGDRVVLAHDCKDLAHGPEVFKKGETGTLGKRYRVQDGIEVWELILDKKRPF